MDRIVAAACATFLIACGARTSRDPSGARDPDGDYVAGSADHCPADSEDHDGVDDADGCPDPDDDHDGVDDADDQCPGIRGTVRGRGCFDVLPRRSDPPRDPH